jgi:hypothetical protein
VAPGVELSVLEVVFLEAAEGAQILMHSTTDLSFVTVEPFEGLSGSLSEQLLAVGGLTGEGSVNDPGFPSGDAEEFPLGVGDLVTEVLLGGAHRREVDPVFEAKALEFLEVFSLEGDGHGGKAVFEGVHRSARATGVRFGTG